MDTQKDGPWKIYFCLTMAFFGIYVNFLECIRWRLKTHRISGKTGIGEGALEEILMITSIPNHPVIYRGHLI